MNAYRYDQKTGFYRGSVEAQKNPVRPEEFLCPAFATFLAPPQSSPGQVAQFTADGSDPSLGSWKPVEIPPLPKPSEPQLTPEQQKVQTVTAFRRKAELAIHELLVRGTGLDEGLETHMLLLAEILDTTVHGSDNASESSDAIAKLARYRDIFKKVHQIRKERDEALAQLG